LFLHEYNPKPKCRLLKIFSLITLFFLQFFPFFFLLSPKVLAVKRRSVPLFRPFPYSLIHLSRLAGLCEDRLSSPRCIFGLPPPFFHYLSDTTISLPPSRRSGGLHCFFFFLLIIPFLIRFQSFSLHYKRSSLFLLSKVEVPPWSRRSSPSFFPFNTSQ